MHLNNKDFCFLLQFLFIFLSNSLFLFCFCWLRSFTSFKRLIRLVPCPINTLQEYGFVRNHLLNRKKVAQDYLAYLQLFFMCNVFVLIFKTLHKIMSHCLLPFEDVKNLHQVVKLPVNIDNVLKSIYEYSKLE